MFSMGKIKHGDNQIGKRNKLYTAWANMKKRCNKPTNRDGGNYKKIKYCQEWTEYLKFKEWALNNGYKEHLTLDRIDVNGDYEPNNCRWITMKEQQRNKTNTHLITYKGKTQSMADWAEEYGLKLHTLKWRIYREWDIERALTEPLGLGRKEAYYKRKKDEKGRLL